ncbi:unnamed protein product [Mytilus coruscus]|uniref:Uncharacterized protein n=1 Tax=Mytilus coruscus TaxID=42192 RepID=A0A6J8EE74_MYTCO|nr:unnamed protein product [Mytilus coruscus]
MNTRRSSKKWKATVTFEAASRQEETQLQPGSVPASNDPSTSGGCSFDVVNRQGYAIGKDHSNLTQTTSYSPSLDYDLTFHVIQNLKQKQKNQTGEYVDFALLMNNSVIDKDQQKVSYEQGKLVIRPVLNHTKITNKEIAFEYKDIVAEILLQWN